MSSENKSPSIVLCISGPSGVGKGSVIKALLKKYPDFKLSISMTTRQPRGQEQDGVEYYFCDKNEFENLIEKKEILEYDIYADEYYGTPLAPIREYIKNQEDVVLDITVAGALQIKKIMPNAIIVFLLPPSLDKLKKRLLGRKTESDQAIADRLKAAEIEMTYAKEFEYTLINDRLKDTVKKLEKIINKNRRRD